MYLKLKNGYRQALEQVDLEYERKRQELDQNCKTALGESADNFRKQGNVGFYLEIRRYVDMMERNQLPKFDPDQFQSDYVKGFHQKYLLAQENLIREERTRNFQVMNLMSTHLQEMIRESTQAENLNLASQLQDDLNKIENDPGYQLAAKEASAAVEAASAKPVRLSDQLLPTPAPPSPVYTKPLLDVDVSKKNISQLARNGDYDDKVQNIRLVIKIRSKEMLRDYKALKVRVWAFGQSVNRKTNFQMQIVENLKVDGLERGHSVEIETETFENVYDDHYTAQYGYKFYGYLLIIEDSKGVELFRKASPSRLEGDLEHIRSKAKGEDFSL